MSVIVCKQILIQFKYFHFELISQYCGFNDLIMFEMYMVFNVTFWCKRENSYLNLTKF